MELKCTPGDWIIVNNYNIYSGDVVGIRIASCAVSEPENLDGCLVYPDLPFEDEAKANARLFRAAPELLNILNDLLLGTRMELSIGMQSRIQTVLAGVHGQ